MTPAAALPPEDRDRSPHTGWTRAHWAALADRMLAALDAHRSPAGARYDLPGPASASGRDSDGLEGFARSFLLAGFRVAGEHGQMPGGLIERYADGLAAGTDPGHPEYWPRPDVLGQAKVEAASIALILQLTRPWLWDRLPDPVRQRTVDWLATVVGQPYPPINWVWFRVVVESFLREVGGPWSAADIEEDLAVHASLRRDGGWLSDGADLRAFDHYTGWALHLYPLLWTRLFDVTGPLVTPGVAARWEDDLARWLGDAVRLVGTDGSPLLQGRSLTYRFAAAAPLWTAALCGVEAPGVGPGLLRRAASGMLRHFADHGAPGPDGLLTLGWHGPWPALRQSYSGPASPYWAAKGMLGLALPAGHPVWTAREEPLPAETGDVARVVTAPGWLVSARRGDDFTLVLNHGTDHAAPGTTDADSPLYARLGYSTATLPPVRGASVGDPLDNAVVLLDDHGRATHRAGFVPLYARELPGGVLAAASAGPVRWVDATGDTSADHGSGRTGTVIPGPRVVVASVLRDGAEVRLARIDAPHPEPGWHAVRFGGWPVSGADEPAARSQGSTAHAATPRLRSTLTGLRGLARGGVTVERDTGPLGAWTAVPWLTTADRVPLGELLACLVLLRPATDTAVPAVTVRPTRPDATEATVTWPDGLTTVVPLPRP